MSRAAGTDQRLRLLDGLRFAAALAVVGFHFTACIGFAWPEGVHTVFPVLGRVTVYGGFGPYLFFMISGFVIMMSAWGRPVSAFIASRVGRLYPAYWCAVLLVGGVVFLGRGVAPFWDSLGLPGIALNLTMLQSAFGVGNVDTVFWTLWVELKFYVLVAVLAHLGLTHRRVLGLTLLWPVVGAFATQAQVTWLVAVLEPTYAPFFCIGLLLYLVYREGWSVVIALLLAMNYVIGLWVCASFFVPWTGAATGTGASFRGVAVLFTLCVGLVATVTLTRLARVDWRWLSFAGALTYPLYLVHQVPGLYLIRALAPVLTPFARVGAAVAAALLVAYLIHRYVERPWGPRLRRAVEKELAATAPDAGPRILERRRSSGRGPALARHLVPAEPATVRMTDLVPSGDRAPTGRVVTPPARPESMPAAGRHEARR